MLLLGTSIGFSFYYFKHQNKLINQCLEKVEEGVTESKERHKDTPPSTQARIRGNYENKIRFFSPPEKIFEVFSSIK
jgi:hypothetical protein